jgi:5'-nucleotidase
MPRTVRGGRGLVALLPLALGLAGCASTGTPRGVAPEAPPPSRLRIVHINDFHGRLLPEPWASPTGAVGGAALLAAHVDSARAGFAGPVLLLTAGDDLQGTAISNLSWGAATIASHNALRVTAAAVGNHEFDWGVDTLRARVAESRFPWLAANVLETASGRPPAWLRPWVLLDTLGVKVALIGAALPETPTVVLAERVAGLTFLPAAPAIDAAAREARAAGAQFVVVTMHIGVACREAGTAPGDRSRDCTGGAAEVAAALREPVDLLVAGHTHRRAITAVQGIPIVEAASYAQAYGVTDLQRGPDGRVTVTDQRIEWVRAEGVTPDTAVAGLVARWDADVRPRTARVVAELGDVLRSGPRDSWLGNLVADAFRAATGAEVVLVNNGSLRRPLPAGPVTYGMLYELQPFQNELVLLRVPGRVLRAAVEHGVAGGAGRGVHLSGVTAVIDTAAAPGARVRALTRPDGRAIGDDDLLDLGLTDFVAGGGDLFTMFRDAPRRPTGLVDLDALVRYLESVEGPVGAPRDRRLLLSGESGPATGAAAARR